MPINISANCIKGGLNETGWQWVFAFELSTGIVAGNPVKDFARNSDKRLYARGNEVVVKQIIPAAKIDFIKFIELNDEFNVGQL
jgi:hypothetical protein